MLSIGVHYASPASYSDLDFCEATFMVYTLATLRGRAPRPFVVQVQL